MKLKRITAVVLVFATSMLQSGVTVASQGNVRQVQPEMYGGIVVDNTITPAGQDFYQYFVAAWRDMALSERYAIAIHERPSARRGTQIWVEFAQRRVFQVALPSGRSAIRSLSEQAVELTAQKVADVDIERLLFRDPDMGADEI